FSYGGRTVTPPTFLSRSHGIPIPMCELRRRGWYWVNTPTVSTPELIQLLSGKSIIRYFPPNATAGFATFSVNTPNLLPWPPASSIAIISFLTMQSPLVIYNKRIIPYFIVFVNNFYIFLSRKSHIFITIYLNFR